MKEFIDETSTVEGTPINRANLMAIQGFIASRMLLQDNGEIVEENINGERLVTRVSDNEITEIFTGEKILQRVTTISGNEVIVTVGGV